MKRLLSLSICVLMIVTLCIGCGKGKGNVDGSGDGTISGFSNEDVSFVLNEESKYVIIRPASASSELTTSVSTIVKAIKSSCGVSAKSRMDDADDGKDTYEILIGDTNRPESDTAYQYLIDNVGGRVDDYIISSIGKKIVIIGATENATMSAVEYFIKNFVKNEVIVGGINYTNKTTGDFKNITISGNDIGKYNIVRQHYNGSYIVQVEMEELSDYIIKETGFLSNIVEDRYVEAGEYEIIVGDTNRPAYKNGLGYNDYSIDIVGNKVYLDGGSYQATAVAVSEFNKLLEKGSVTEADSTSGNYEDILKTYDKSTQYTLTWYDEFEGNSVDLTKWTLKPPGTEDKPGINGKLSVRTDDPLITFVKDGKFQIHAAYDDNFYYGGMIESEGKTSYKYGYIEMSCIVPQGAGFWTTLWMISTEKNGLFWGEIDVNECYGNATVVGGNYHAWPTNQGLAMGKEHYCGIHGDYVIPNTEYDDEHLGLNFHTYGFMWTDTWIGGTVDGVFFQEFDISNNKDYIDVMNDSPMYLLISVGTYKQRCPLTPNATAEEWQTTNKYIVENVDIYQLYDGKHELNGKVLK